MFYEVDSKVFCHTTHGPFSLFLTILSYPVTMFAYPHLPIHSVSLPSPAYPPTLSDYVINICALTETLAFLSY